MEVKIESERENPFFNRKDLVISVAHKGEATPSKEAIKKWISEKYSVDVEQVLIDYIFTRAGVPESKVKAKVLNEKPKKKEENKVEEEKKEDSNEAQNNSGGESSG